MANPQERTGSLWQRLTGRPEGHEGPWPEDTGGTWLGLLSGAAFFLAAAMAINIMLAEFGAHPALRFLVTCALVELGILAVRARRARPS
jgi:hypothetical protein